MIVRGALTSTHPHSCWCRLPGNLSKCSCQTEKPGPVPSPAPWGSLGSLCYLQKPATSEKRTGHFCQGPPWPESLHVATSQTSVPSVQVQGIPCGPGGPLARTWQLERELGLLNLGGWGQGRSQHSLSLPGRGSLPHKGPKPEPRPRASCVALPAPWPIFHGSHPSIVHTGCGCRRPHPEAERPGSSESVCSHSWACPRGGSAWPRHSSPCQLPSVP